MKSVIWLLVLFAAGLPLVAQENPDPVQPEDPAPAVVKPKPVKPDAVREYKAKRYGEAIAICLNEIKETPGNRYSYIVLGWSLIAQGKYSEAFDYTRLGIERTGSDQYLIENAEESLTKLYAWFYNQGRYDDALPAIQRFISYLPNSTKVPTAYALLGDIYLKKGQYIYADTALSYALHSNPNAFEWWLGAGLAREKFGDYKSALAAYGEALKLDPSHQEALRGRDRMREKLSLAVSPAVP